MGNECGGKNENEGSKVGIRFFGFIFGELESLMYHARFRPPLLMFGKPNNIVTDADRVLLP